MALNAYAVLLEYKSRVPRALLELMYQESHAKNVPQDHFIRMNSVLIIVKTVLPVNMSRLISLLGKARWTA